MKTVIETSDAPKAIGPYSQAIRSGDLVFLSGQIPLDPATGELVRADVATETVRVLDNLDAAGRFKPAGVLRDELRAVIGPRDPREVVLMCGWSARAGRPVPAGRRPRGPRGCRSTRR